MSSLNELLAAIDQHLRSGALDDAMAICRQALSRAPRSPRVLKTYGTCLLATGDAGSAITAFRAALAIEPDDAGANHDLGLALLAQDDQEGARLSFERALTIAPDNASTHEALAGLLAELGDMDAAIRHMLVAVELKPDDPTTLANFASVLSGVGAYLDARVHLERALAIDPENPDIVLPLARILHELGEHQEALAIVERAYLKRPRDPVILAGLATAYLKTGDYERAVEPLERALKNAPDFIAALDAFTMLAAYQGEPEKGIAHLAGLLRTHKGNPLLSLSLATAMSRDGRHADALAFASEALRQKATRGNAFLIARQSLALMGRFEEANALAHAMGAGKAPETPAAFDTVIVPLETKPLEAVLLSRFLAADAQAQPQAAVYAPEQIAPLLRRMDSGRQILPLGEADMGAPGATFIAQLATDERMARYRPDAFAAYIKADPRADDFWRGSLAPFKRPFIGITWGKYRPNPLLSDLDAALKDWPGTIFSLTWDDQRAELEGNKRIVDAGRHLQSLEALIDMIGQLDGVLAPDGLAMHIAGAMGVPGIVLTTPEKPWYWYAEDDRSHWYPSVSVLTRPWQEAPEAFSQRIAERLDVIAGGRRDD